MKSDKSISEIMEGKSKKVLSDEEAEEMQETIKELRKDKGFRDNPAMN